MTQTGVSALNALLFEGGLEVANIKFLPGADRGLTTDAMCSAACAAIKGALAGDMISRAPVTGRTKSLL